MVGDGPNPKCEGGARRAPPAGSPQAEKGRKVKAPQPQGEARTKPVFLLCSKLDPYRKVQALGESGMFGIPVSWLNASGIALVSLFLLYFTTRDTTSPTFVGRFSRISLMIMIVFFFVILVSFAMIVATSNGQSDSLFVPAKMLRPLLVWNGVILAIVLYKLRKKHHLAYGVLEIMVATTTLIAISYVMSFETFTTTTIGFLGGVYVLIRGMTNFEEARGKPPAADQDEIVSQP